MSRFDLPAPEVVETGSLLREPASEDDIRLAEDRLGVSLPPTYRAFLLTSNGAHASSLGPEVQHWGETRRHGFVSADRIRRLAEVDDGPFLIGIWTGDAIFIDPERDKPPQGDEIAAVAYYVPMRDALLISEPMDVFRDLLVPRAGREEWEVWQFAKEGAGAYRDFAAFLRNQINRPDRRPNPELADLYAAEVRDGKRPRLHDLAEIGDPRVGALIRCGDPEIGKTLRAIAADPDDGAQRWAGLVLPQLRRAPAAGAPWPLSQ